MVITFTSDEFRLLFRTKIFYFIILLVAYMCKCVCGQVERINRTIISVLSKMSEDDPTKWFKHVPSLQEVLNSTFQRSINTTFELLLEHKSITRLILRIQQIIIEQLQLEFNETENSYVKRQNRK
ncbi:hypothetical protein TNIN_89001 [Trichonephila inaurata madagascariensis]|uniref:Uncharacterized protein n=1 Tax=Trichonephila inaurata madagascariensis TaxID=2747483 RepID=A0A8X6YZE5_9ARAC|nr:hypothetical protein TNIN_89001 [Trichonephila inaurata madagascariensis]